MPRLGSVLFLSALKAAGLGAVFCLAATPALAEAPPRPVMVAAATERDVSLYVEANGSLKAAAVVSIMPQVSGTLLSVHFEEGDDVKRDDLLFSIDPRVYKARLEKTKAAVIVAQTQLQETERKIKRLAALAKSDFVSRQNLEDVKSQAAVQAAELKEARADVKLAQIDLENCDMRAPISGRAGLIQIKPGNLVAAGQGTALVVLQDLDPLYVDFSLAEKNLPTVLNSLVAGELEIQVRIAGQNDQPRRGRLAFLSNRVDPSTGTFLARGVLTNTDRSLWPGQFVRVRLITGQLRGAVLIPSLALQIGEKEHYVFVVNKAGEAEYRTVVPGERYGSETVITRGLKPGERVVTVGQLGLKPDGKVKIITKAAAGKKGP